MSDETSRTDTGRTDTGRTDTGRTAALGVALWIAQGLLALTFAGTGVWKLTTPPSALGAVFPWMGRAPTLVIVTGVFDLLGGLGVLLPSLTRIQPRLTVLAAAGCLVLQAAAIAFHVSRGEAASTPFNVTLVALCAFVIWGRGRARPIAPR